MSMRPDVDVDMDRSRFRVPTELWLTPQLENVSSSESCVSLSVETEFIVSNRRSSSSSVASVALDAYESSKELLELKPRLGFFDLPPFMILAA
jgi:hypothetical protein